ncbi:hypothetical protein LWI29_016006 [Acer saccharum]|uniref:DUF4283 domain-containing protein n=1 Tax=Acer saccharum TaxID=4024 RepID=A0AA39T3K8_ACESA|nr:hypothetical protein LWI29_016006 [Acer saccharum]
MGGRRVGWYGCDNAQDRWEGIGSQILRWGHWVRSTCSRCREWWPTGFFQILLNSEEDKAQVWGIGSLQLKPGILRLQPWTQNFNPNTQRTTNAQIWVRFYDLPWEFWHPQILSDMARGVGIPLKFDRATLEGDYGHFARMLIDVDLSKPLPDSIMIEVGEDCLFPTLYFENVPMEDLFHHNGGADIPCAAEYICSSREQIAPSPRVVSVSSHLATIMRLRLASHWSAPSPRAIRASR